GRPAVCRRHEQLARAEAAAATEPHESDGQALKASMRSDFPIVLVCSSAALEGRDREAEASRHIERSSSSQSCESLTGIPDRSARRRQSSDSPDNPRSTAALNQSYGTAQITGSAVARSSPTNAAGTPVTPSCRESRSWSRTRSR